MTKKKTAIVAIILFFVFALTSCLSVTGTDAEKIAASCLPAVLELSVTFQASTGYATGFIVSSDGYVLTNAHVVTKEGSFFEEALTVSGRFYNSKTEYALELITYDLTYDVAVLKFYNNSLTLSHIETADSESLSYGSDIYVIGNAENYGLGITKGIISAPKRTFKDMKTAAITDVIQIDAPINSGSSGAPLLNSSGRAIGMITFKLMTESSEGIGFAVTSKNFLNVYEKALKP